MGNGRAKVVAAFFDVDETILKGNSMSSFYWYYYLKRSEKSESALLRALQKAKDSLSATCRYLRFFPAMMKDDDRLTVNIQYYRSLRGIPVEEYGGLIREWFQDKAGGDKYHGRVVAQLRRHQAENHLVVLVTGSHMPLIKPIQQELGVSHIIATEVEVLDQAYTGNILNKEPLVGAGKANAVRAFAQRYGINLSRSYAYSDHLSDRKMLEAVGIPCVVAGDKRLRGHALRERWTIIDA